MLWGSSRHEQWEEIPGEFGDSQAPPGKWEMLGNSEGWGVWGSWPWGRGFSVSAGACEEVREGQKSFCPARKPEAGGSEITTVI